MKNGYREPGGREASADGATPHTDQAQWLR